LDLDVDASIELTVWLGEGNPDLAGDDWAHVQAETRASTATLNQGNGPDDVSSFDVDSNTVSFDLCLSS
jgi:hypothetical protein